MKTILTVIRKELISTLRDRRTLISAILIPAIAVPLLILGVTKLQMAMREKEEAKELRVATVNAPHTLDSLLSADPSIKLVRTKTGLDIAHTGMMMAAKDSVAEEHLDAALFFASGETRNELDSIELFTEYVRFFYKSTNEAVEDRITEKLNSYKSIVLKARFQQLHIDSALLNPVAVTPVDVASTQEQIGILLGGFIPYIFIIFCFVGCLYPTLDIITGEKEKGTIETLLTAPASRLHILLGKILAITIVGVCAAIMTIAGMFVTLRLAADIPAEILTVVNGILNAKFILMLFAMLIPLSLFFAGMLSAVVIRAASFKEAQSYATPLMFVAIIPAMLALTPGIELTWQTAWIPILNIALATKEIIAGTINGAMYAAIVVSLVVLAGLAVLASRRQFSKEGNILK